MRIQVSETCFLPSCVAEDADAHVPFPVFPSILCVFPAADLHPEEPPPNLSNGVIITNQCDDSG